MIMLTKSPIGACCRAYRAGPLLAAAGLLLASCNLLTPLVFMGEHKKKVLPEFDKLPNKRVAIHVWTEPATLFDYPYARLEIATYVADKLRYELAQRQRNTVVIDSRDVEDYLHEDLDARADPRLLGRHFDVDYVVFLEILTFQMRDPEQPPFLQGHIEASVQVVDVNAGIADTDAYELIPVTCIFPERAPVLLTQTNSPQIREATYIKFAEMVARKFYEYTVDLM